MTENLPDQSTVDPDGALQRCVDWLEALISTLDDMPGEKAIDYCDSAGDEIQQSIGAFKSSPPKPGSAGALVILEVFRAFVQVMLRAAMDDSVPREIAAASFKSAVDGIRNDAVSWLQSGLPADDEIKSGTEAAKAAIQAAEKVAADRLVEDDVADAYAHAHPYGAMLGYHDPEVDAAVVFTQVCEFSEAEHEKYSEAHGRLKRLVDQDLFSYVSDMSDAFIDVVCEVLRDIQSRVVPISDQEALHKRVRKVRSSLIAFTSALHSHQDQTLYQVKQDFGDGSTEHAAVKALFNDFYSNVFAYRWLIELRHVMLHISIDAFTISITARVDDDASMELGMSRYWMKKSSGIMKKAYKRTELEGMEADPSILDMIRDLQPEFGPLQDKIDAILHPAAQVEEDVATVRELIGRFNGRRGLYALQTGPGFTRRLRIPSYSQLDPRVLSFADQYESGGESPEP